MNQLDIYHRSFKEYRKETLNDNDCKKRRRYIQQVGTQFDKLETIKYLCTIDSDWIEAIENELEYVEKAVKEERQFIRANGEVVPIEKAKKVSRASVEHLAKHANLVTKEPVNGTDIIPDEIYMVEKLSDFAIYENRFLYLLLCYLRDFITLRLEKILEIRKTYISNLSMKKESNTLKSEFLFELNYHEKSTNNAYPLPDKTSTDLLKRIENCQQIVNSLLNTDVMIQVAKSPKIKPPIIKTNVLKMNNNFKHALALYNYVTSYVGDGFKSEEVKIVLNPFSEKVREEYSESINLLLFLTFKYGNKLEEELEENYLDEEKRREIEEIKRLSLQIERLKKRLHEDDKSMEDYILSIEDQNKLLFKRIEELKILEDKIKELNLSINSLNEEIEELKNEIIMLQKEISLKLKEIEELNLKYIRDMQELREKHQLEIEELISKHNDELFNQEVRLKNEYEDLLKIKLDEKDNEMDKIINDYKIKLDSLNKNINDLNLKHESVIKDYDSRQENLNKSLFELNETLKLTEIEFEKKVLEIEEENKKIKEKNSFIMAEVHGLRTKYNMHTDIDDYTSEDRFKELEEEFKSLKRFFKQNWRLTKKKIRKDILWKKEDK